MVLGPSDEFAIIGNSSLEVSVPHGCQTRAVERRLLEPVSQRNAPSRGLALNGRPEEAAMKFPMAETTLLQKTLGQMRSCESLGCCAATIRYPSYLLRQDPPEALLTVRLVQYRAPMHRDMVGLIAVNLVLRLFFAGTMHVSFVIHVLDVDLDDLPLTYPASEFQVMLSPTLNRLSMKCSPPGPTCWSTIELYIRIRRRTVLSWFDYETGNCAQNYDHRPKTII